ncbi:endonuclease domain-containing protein [Streptomyces sp. ECR3.8]|uniref:endonuclease domain-containing protein n=1 Tax=Streptomyces sp. ECR3.8 TaxID=3461009 RepID=UPI00404233B9
MHCTNCVACKADRERLRRYGVTRKQWLEMRARYEGKCWLCKDNPADAVDHCHETNRVRGALCRVCNMVLHYVERPRWWADAKVYLNGGDEHCGTEVQLP